MNNGLRYRNDYTHTTREGGFHLRINCSECSNTEFAKISSATCDQNFANRLFRSKGWCLGSSRKGDLCPTCIAQEKKLEADRRAQRINKNLEESKRLQQTVFGAALKKAADKQLETPRPVLKIVSPTPEPQPYVDIPLLKKHIAAAPPYIDTPPRFEQPGWNSEEPKMTTKTNQKPVRRVLTSAEVFRIGNFLESRLHLVGEKIVKYHPEWSDARVADEMQKEFPGINKGHIERCRIDLFGKLWEKAVKQTAKQGDYAALEKRISDLEDMVLKLQDDVKVLQQGRMIRAENVR